jgi:hypothetical protein
MLFLNMVCLTVTLTISILIFVFRLNLDFAESYLLICILSGLGATVMGEGVATIRQIILRNNITD